MKSPLRAKALKGLFLLFSFLWIHKTIRVRLNAHADSLLSLPAKALRHAI